MTTQNKYNTIPTADKQPSDPKEQYHGDLRKGAYLKRRAAYRMRAARLVARHRNQD